MNSRFHRFSAAQLKTILIHEMRGLALALEYGSAISDLQEIKDQMKLLADTLFQKESEEFGIAEILPQAK
ncbi:MULTISPECIES: hypothetical protein [Niastella]|uniref:Uncharacterized protein n=1 Tax=Niastella soli TaxID=2821487 RepID=A0ABS3YVF5_9BACT|nr:hypothetical protein [Niastella soli]MBO9201921.1 hypothetical protein [Niastella soli]